ncbi:conserved hypothetical protein [Treponema primitia ZAS-2]|uniref:ABC-transporter type IV n=1 Tax=Treponema primitia (strain ATCC BAA-887 / DSM 12427 / ZAS-2) TaxID=545694 RepID=F5YQJ0_TREPZ|nr:putative ABC transporter permease [Treponema primitia]AEF85566.1 conserved hypothetical protein [Treponema primitia ZAS-2]
MDSILSLDPKSLVFAFFFFSFSGWVGETIMESLVRKRFVSKGFFKGPWVPVHGVGGFAVYAAGFPLKARPILLFITSTLLCTAVEYLAALLLEKVFNKKCWDYDTYPFTWWCHYKKRIALTTSLFFGLVALVLVYFYWDLAMDIARFIGPQALFIIDLVLVTVFLVDAFFTIRKYIKNKIAGIENPIDGLL